MVLVLVWYFHLFFFSPITYVYAILYSRTLAIEYKWKEAGAFTDWTKSKGGVVSLNGRCDFCKRLQNANNGLRKPYLVVRRTGVTRLHAVRDGEEVKASTKLLVPNAKSSSLPSALYSTLASSLILPAPDHQQIAVLKARWRKIAVRLGRK